MAHLHEFLRFRKRKFEKRLRLLFLVTISLLLTARQGYVVMRRDEDATRE
jgi:hypothetical protein